MNLHTKNRNFDSAAYQNQHAITPSFLISTMKVLGKTATVKKPQHSSSHKKTKNSTTNTKSGSSNNMNHGQAAVNIETDVSPENKNNRRYNHYERNYLKRRNAKNQQHGSSDQIAKDLSLSSKSGMPLGKQLSQAILSMEMKKALPLSTDDDEALDEFFDTYDTTEKALISDNDDDDEDQFFDVLEYSFRLKETNECSHVSKNQIPRTANDVFTMLQNFIDEFHNSTTKEEEEPVFEDVDDPATSLLKSELNNIDELFRLQNY